jgi:hypothetical protein
MHHKLMLILIDILTSTPTRYLVQPCFVPAYPLFPTKLRVIHIYAAHFYE